MKKLYLHIGLGKTGSSAIQSWLSLNAETLERQGIAYADLVPRAKLGVATSGNGKVLVQSCRKNDFHEMERLLGSTYFSSGRSSTAIVSSENLQDVRPKKLRKMQEICQRHGIHITVIACMRSVYERAFSAYVQRVKNLGATHKFSEGDVMANFSRTMINLRKYAELFGEDMLVWNYDDTEQDIFASFSAITDIRYDETELPAFQVNRGLTLEELEVTRTLNALHQGVFSAAISSFLIKRSPDRRTFVDYIDDLVEKVRIGTKTDLQWINQRFNLNPPVRSDLLEDGAPQMESSQIKEVYQAVALWAATYAPSAELRR